MTRARCEESVRDLGPMHDTKPQRLLGLHFRNVLRDALCAERELAHCLSHIARRSSRHRVRRELVYMLRGSSGAAFKSGLYRGNDIARSAHLLRPAGHRRVRSCHARCAADFGTMGRQHHRRSGRPRESRSGSRRVELRVRARCAVRSHTSVPHYRAGRARRLRGCERHPTRSRQRSSRVGPHVGQRKEPTSGKPGHAVERGDPGNVGSNGTFGGEPKDGRAHVADPYRTGRAGGP
jgi:hypothetical protein